jgi:hypothetical protein
MPRTTVKKAAKKVAAKKTTKKTTKRVAKKAVAKRARKPVAEPVQIEAVEIDARQLGEALHQAAEAALEDGGFSTAGLLNAVVRNKIGDARGVVTRAVRNLVSATVATTQTVATRGEADVLEAKQRLAVAEFEQAMDSYEAVIRG